MQITATPKTRLFSTDVLIEDSESWLTGEQAKYVSRVLRLKIDDSVVLFDGEGGEYAAVIKEFAKDRVLLAIGHFHADEVESPLGVQLVQGLSRGGRMDVVIQKSTELGVRRIQPLITEHSVVKLDADKALKRREHWLRVSQSACEQCGRNTVPEIAMPQTLPDWLGSLPKNGASKIMLQPGSADSIATLPTPVDLVTLLVGPEGGLSDAERQQCETSGFRPISLGPRILRTETAALAGIAVLQARWGDLGRV